MRYFIFSILIILFNSCIKKSDNSQSEKIEQPLLENYNWFPKVSEDQLYIYEVAKIKDEINRLLAAGSVEEALEEIHFQDQIYRDSINTVTNLDQRDKKRLYKKMGLFDDMNTKIAIELLRKSSWPKTNRMSVEAQEALCLVAIHNNTKELNQLVSAHFDEAYYKESSFSGFMFAAVIDRLSLRSGGNYIYGTLRFRKENYTQTEINKINKNRSQLGLDLL